ncbi:uncharacterized protein A1O9_05821 [Exophiala aquamarina CBS 119918]|uniref:RNA helicase n=1 Tax=Exophiala aquamarina CBS 119918 TaxID=1182545 RepID=A0A072PCT6_9EURO|nr:uncharacterized protein A1O9_05821 [Exophiala aquamarina CBS 119918]KEF57899.1 hypothetical protein A1O9_05821 [Exophiala aquamarina CBS 119918]
MNEEARQVAHLQGWVEPKAYNYDNDLVSENPATNGTNHCDVINEDGDNANSGGQGDQSGHCHKWAHDAGRYEWKEEFGDVGPRSEKLEEELFNGKYINRAGEKFKNLTTVKVIVESEERPKPINNFTQAGIHPILVENIQRCGYETPTPIQAYTIPAVITGHDMIGVAQTGSGKTAAFLIPCISKLMGKVKKLAARRPNLAVDFDVARERVRAEPLILIVAPTRELCCQIFDEARRLCYRSMLRPCVAYGGGPMRDQIAQLNLGCDLLVATPGRLLDFMGRPEVLSLSRVRYTIIDEADELLHDDWEQEMTKIMSGGDANTDGDHRYLLFSATFPKRLKKLAAKFLANDHVHVSIGRTGSVHCNVKQQIIWAEPNAKHQALYDLLISMPPSRTLVFVRSKKTADFVDDYLFNLGLPSTSIHSDRLQIEREDALRSFKTGDSPILVATGVSARGLDVKHVMHVINFDLPLYEHDGTNEFVHRIGRTARIGNEGLATSFYNDKDSAMGPFITKILMETGQAVPEFLEQYKPNGDLDFDEDDPDVDEDNEGAALHGNDDAWGGGEDNNAVGVSEPAWGANNSAHQEAWGTTNEAATAAW